MGLMAPDYSEALEQIIDGFPNDAAILAQAACCLYAGRRTGRALEVLGQALELRPDSPELLWQRASYRQRFNMTRGAVEDLLHLLDVPSPRQGDCAPPGEDLLLLVVPPGELEAVQGGLPRPAADVQRRNDPASLPRQRAGRKTSWHHPRQPPHHLLAAQSDGPLAPTLGGGCRTFWTCDPTQECVRLNADCTTWISACSLFRIANKDEGGPVPRVGEGFVSGRNRRLRHLHRCCRRPGFLRGPHHALRQLARQRLDLGSRQPAQPGLRFPQRLRPGQRLVQTRARQGVQSPLSDRFSPSA
jgi:hypothetical protein